MGKRGPKPKTGIREPNGQLSRRNEHVQARGDVPHVGWFVYFATAGGLTKVGYSGNVKRRLYMLGYDHKAALRLMGLIAASDETDARAKEADTHKRLIARGYHYEREWFDMSEGDVRRELDRMRDEGLDVRSVATGGDRPPLLPVNKATDATGRKFAGVAAR